MYLGLAILMGTAWLRLSYSQENIQNVLNALFFGSAFMSFMVSTPSMPLIMAGGCVHSRFSGGQIRHGKGTRERPLWRHLIHHCQHLDWDPLSLYPPLLRPWLMSPHFTSVLFRNVLAYQFAPRTCAVFQLPGDSLPGSAGGGISCGPYLGGVSDLCCRTRPHSFRKWALDDRWGIPCQSHRTQCVLEVHILSIRLSTIRVFCTCQESDGWERV
jgi:hypothetical protein